MKKPTTVSGTKFRKRPGLSHWRSILEHWIELHDRYCNFSTEDAAYWYTERTNAGMLSNATWSAGFFAVEEHQKDKRGNADGRKRSKGRGDLWIGTNTLSESIETKQKYIQLGHSRNQTTLEAHLRLARNDAHRARSTSDLFHTGILFAPPYIPVEKLAQRPIEDLIESTVSAISEAEFDFAAWVFPAAARNLHNRKGNHIYPGIVILGKRTGDA